MYHYGYQIESLTGLLLLFPNKREVFWWILEISENEKRNFEKIIVTYWMFGKPLSIYLKRYYVENPLFIYFFGIGEIVRANY